MLLALDSSIVSPWIPRAAASATANPTAAGDLLRTA
jgi:hypothetical protein